MAQYSWPIIIVIITIFFTADGTLEPVDAGEAANGSLVAVDDDGELAVSVHEPETDQISVVSVLASMGCCIIKDQKTWYCPLVFKIEDLGQSAHGVVQMLET